MEIAPSSSSLTCGHVIGCFGVWYRSDREGGTDVHACFGPDLHSRRDGRTCYMSCRRIFAVSWHEYREDARYRRSSKVLSNASRFRHVVNINTASITKTADDDGWLSRGIKAIVNFDIVVRVIERKFPRENVMSKSIWFLREINILANKKNKLHNMSRLTWVMISR